MRRRQKIKRPEQDIHRAVMNHLRQRSAPNTFAFHIPNGGKRPSIEAAIMKGLGVVAGVPDICVIKGGCAHFLELKAPRGVVSEKQGAVHCKLWDAGCRVAVAYSLDEALIHLEAWGILRGISTRAAA